MKIKTITLLVEKYFEGLTSLQEEKQLRKYFENENIPDELKHYQPLFRYFTKEIKENPKNGLLVAGFTEKKKRYIWLWTATAAAAIILFLVCMPLATDNQEQSLAYINGKKTTDMFIIVREAFNELDGFASDNDDTIASQIEALDIFIGN